MLWSLISKKTYASTCVALAAVSQREDLAALVGVSYVSDANANNLVLPRQRGAAEAQAQEIIVSVRQYDLEKMTTSWEETVDFTKAHLDADSEDDEADPNATRVMSAAAAAATPNRRSNTSAIVFRRQRSRDR